MFVFNVIRISTLALAVFHVRKTIYDNQLDSILTDKSFEKRNIYYLIWCVLIFENKCACFLVFQGFQIFIVGFRVISLMQLAILEAVSDDCL